jgi:hypothetical protein
MIELGYESTKMMTYDEAVMYCFFYSQDGKKGWRMPTGDEYDEYYELARSWYQDDTLKDDPDETWLIIPVRDINDN